ncbi:unnamed protein product, partial [Ixodes hexagonus]
RGVSLSNKRLTTKTGCPRRVYVKYPGEPLPASAKECRKLWLPEHTFKKETFWECEDTKSSECGRSTRATSHFLDLVADASTRHTGDAGGARMFTPPTTMASPTIRTTVSSPCVPLPTTTASSTIGTKDSSTIACVPSTSTTRPTTEASSTTRTTVTPSTTAASSSATPSSISSRPQITCAPQETTMRRRRRKTTTTSTSTSTTMPPSSTTTEASARATGRKLFPFHRLRTSFACPTSTESATAENSNSKHLHYETSPTTSGSYVMVRTRRKHSHRTRSPASLPKATNYTASLQTTPTSTRSTLCVELSAEQIAQLRETNDTLADILETICSPTHVICTHSGQRNCVPPVFTKTLTRVPAHHNHHDLRGRDQVRLSADGVALLMRGPRLILHNGKGSSATAFLYPLHEAVGTTTYASESTRTSTKGEPYTHPAPKTSVVGNGSQASTSGTTKRSTTYPGRVSSKRPAVANKGRVHVHGASPNPRNKEIDKRSYDDLAMRVQRERQPEQSIPFRLNLVKSKMSLNAVMNLKCPGNHCPRKVTSRPRHDTIVVRTVPVGDDEYEYYYVYDEDEKSPRSVTGDSI